MMWIVELANKIYGDPFFEVVFCIFCVIFIVLCIYVSVKLIQVIKMLGRSFEDEEE